MHVKALVPWRSVRIAPLSPGATIVAFSPTLFGAAFMALAISSSSVGAAFALVVASVGCMDCMFELGPSAAHPVAVRLNTIAPVQTQGPNLLVMMHSPR